MPTVATSCSEKSSVSDNQWYLAQIEKMLGRYVVLHRRLGWRKADNWFDGVFDRLDRSPLWCWSFLCGHEADLRTVTGLKPSTRRHTMNHLTDERVERIVGKYYKVRSYVKNL